MAMTQKEHFLRQELNYYRGQTKKWKKHTERLAAAIEDLYKSDSKSYIGLPWKELRDAMEKALYDLENTTLKP